MEEIALIDSSITPQQSPSELANSIDKLSKEIESSKDKVNSILDQNWWKSRTNRGENIKTIVRTILKQNDTISTFLNIVNSLMGWSMVNTIYITEVVNELETLTEARGVDKNQYMSMAKSFLKEGINAAENTSKKIQFNTNKIESLQFQINELITSQIDSEKKIAHKISSNVTLIEKNSEEVESIKKLQTIQLEKIDSTNSAINNHAIEIKTLEESHKSVHDSIKTLQKQLDEIQILVSRQGSAINELNTKSEDASGIIKKMGVDVISNKNLLSNLSEEVNTLNRNYDETNSSLNEILLNVDKQTIVNKQLNDKLFSTNTSISELSVKVFDQFSTTETNCKNDLNSLDSKLSNQNNSLKTEIEKLNNLFEQNNKKYTNLRKLTIVSFGIIIMLITYLILWR